MEKEAKTGAAIKQKMLIGFVKKCSLQDAKKYRELIVQKDVPIDEAVAIVTKSKQKTDPFETVLKLYSMVKRRPDMFSNEALKSILSYIDLIQKVQHKN